MQPISKIKEESTKFSPYISPLKVVVADIEYTGEFHICIHNKLTTLKKETIELRSEKSDTVFFLRAYRCYFVAIYYILSSFLS